MDRIKGRFNFGKIPGIGFDSSKVAKQSFAKECNINTIVSKYKKSGVVTLHLGQPLYGDFSQVGSYHEALIRIQKADEEFNSLPAKVRERFGNDPGALFEFLAKTDDESIKLSVELGLRDKSVLPKPPEVPVVPPQAAKP